MFKELADELNKEERLNDYERLFVLSRVADNVVHAAHQWLHECVVQRAQVIARTPPDKIITLDGLTPRKGNKIIT